MGVVSGKCCSYSLQCRRAVSQLYFQNISSTLQPVKGLNLKQLISENRNRLKTKKCYAGIPTVYIAVVEPG
jgi:hypothetical protein